MQLTALKLVRGLESAVIWARDPAKAELAATEMQDALGIEIVVAPDIETAVTSAEIVVTTTPSVTPLVQANWLQPGQLVIAMGSDQEHKVELDPACLTRATLYVPDSQSQCALKGELRSALEAGLIPKDRHFDALGDITAGKAPGRQSDNDIIIADLTGTGVQDTAIATLARQRAEAAGTGATFTS
jgi:ornithine cyclodeaminase